MFTCHFTSQMKTSFLVPIYCLWTEVTMGYLGDLRLIKSQQSRITVKSEAIQMVSFSVEMSTFIIAN